MVPLNAQCGISIESQRLLQTLRTSRNVLTLKGTIATEGSVGTCLTKVSASPAVGQSSSQQEVQSATYSLVGMSKVNPSKLLTEKFSFIHSKFHVQRTEEQARWAVKKHHPASPQEKPPQTQCTRIPEVQQAVFRHTILVTHASTKESTKAISSVLPKSMPKKTQKLGKERDYHLHIFGQVKES